jgi:excinuclease ABC subunit C
MNDKIDNFMMEIMEKITNMQHEIEQIKTEQNIMKIKGENNKTETILSKQGILEIPINSPAFNLLQQIRDESHRFAISSNRKKKNQSIRYSALDQIHGLGFQRKQSLLNHFKSLKKIRAASINELCTVQGISIKLATEIYKQFKKK